jgi:4-hydroxy-tetrahydrodipicolinate reductase
MIKIGIAGAAGRMGHLLMKAVREHDSTLLAGISVRADDREELNTYLQREGLVQVVLASDAATLVASCDAVIDFTAPDYSVEIAQACAARGSIHICGTTGFNDAQLQQLHAAATHCRLVRAANFSIGVNVLTRVAEQVARLLGNAYDVEIIEMHHHHKKDAPSGTALALGEAVAAGHGVALSEVATHGRVGQVGERVQGEIGFHAVRGGDVIGDHTVIFAGNGERIELTHRSSNRRIYADGAVRAALWAMHQPHGLYSMQDVLASSFL